jgi:hypothetical protein
MEINKRNYPFPMTDGRWPMPHPRPTPVKFNFFHLLSVVLLGLTATACSGSLPSSGQAGVESPSVTQSKASPTTEVGAPSKPNAQGWVTLYPGEAADGLEFSKDGKLSLKRKFPRDPGELPLETITRWDFPALGKISYMTTIDETLT